MSMNWSSVMAGEGQLFFSLSCVSMKYFNGSFLSDQSRLPDRKIGWGCLSRTIHLLATIKNSFGLNALTVPVDLPVYFRHGSQKTGPPRGGSAKNVLRRGLPCRGSRRHPGTRGSRSHDALQELRLQGRIDPCNAEARGRYVPTMASQLGRSPLATSRRSDPGNIHRSACAIRG